MIRQIVLLLLIIQNCCEWCAAFVCVCVCAREQSVNGYLNARVGRDARYWHGCSRQYWAEFNSIIRLFFQHPHFVNAWLANYIQSLRMLELQNILSAESDWGYVAQLAALCLAHFPRVALLERVRQRVPAINSAILIAMRRKSIFNWNWLTTFPTIISVFWEMVIYFYELLENEQRIQINNEAIYILLVTYGW